jgi:aldehyde:ferredoxin oxidoreductase
MVPGYNGKILRVNLSRRVTSVEQPPDDFYRSYMGGTGFVAYFLLHELTGGEDPLGPENKLIFTTGPVTGVPVCSAGRNGVGAKSPLTNGFGDSQVGGYWGAELKHAGYDAIIVEGKSENPVYLWIEDGKVEIRNARHLWGKTTGESQKLIREELGDGNIRIAQIGIGGENLVRFACIINDLMGAAGRTGLGAVMGSKKLKAIAVRGHQKKVPVAHEEAVKSFALKLRDDLKADRFSQGMSKDGTAAMVLVNNTAGGLPTRNFQQGVFENAGKISHKQLNERILAGRRGCFACSIRCKPEVSPGLSYDVDPAYGGPEYETLASLGSNCGIDNLEAIVKGNQLCNAYGLDTISTGVSIAFAMECFEHGILTQGDTGGLALNFGNADAMLKLIEMIARKEGIGAVLAEGAGRAALTIGKGAEKLAMEVKNQEIPMHEPRLKAGLGLGYAVSPTGADHCHNIHDTVYTRRISSTLSSLGVLQPLPAQELSPAKVRLFVYGSLWQHVTNCMVSCYFVRIDPGDMSDLVNGITGWNTTAWELMKVAERAVAMARLFDVREGITLADDCLPGRFFIPLETGPLKGVGVKEAELARAKNTYYEMMSWDKVSGAPTLAKLQELGIEWAASCMKGKGK